MRGTNAPMAVDAQPSLNAARHSGLAKLRTAIGADAAFYFCCRPEGPSGSIPSQDRIVTKGPSLDENRQQLQFAPCDDHGLAGAALLVPDRDQ